MEILRTFVVQPRSTALDLIAYMELQLRFLIRYITHMPRFNHSRHAFTPFVTPSVTPHTPQTVLLIIIRRHSFVTAYYYCYRVRFFKVYLRWVMPLLVDLEALRLYFLVRKRPCSLICVVFCVQIYITYLHVLSSVAKAGHTGAHTPPT